MLFLDDTFLVKGPEPSLVIAMDTSGTILRKAVVDAGGDDYNTIVSSPNGNFIYFGGDLDDTVTLGNNFLNGGELPFVARWQPFKNNIITGIIQSFSNTKSISLFPNPSSGLFTFAFSGTQNVVSGMVEIYNVMGERVERRKLKVESEEIDLTGQPNGVYFYRVISEDGNLIGEGKMIIQK